MRLFTLDVIEAIESIKSFISEFKNPLDVIDFFLELNDLKNIILELYMEEKGEISLEEFISILEEQIQFDLNKLSTKVEMLERSLNKDKNETTE